MSELLDSTVPGDRFKGGAPAWWRASHTKEGKQQHPRALLRAEVGGDIIPVHFADDPEVTRRVGLLANDITAERPAPGRMPAMA